MPAKNIALGGILTALTLVILYLSLLIPTNTLTLLTLAAFMVPVALIKSGVKTSLLVYVCSSILCFLLLPLNISLLYFLFFGCYGIIKYFIERMDQIILEWLLKFLFFNTIFLISIKLILSLISPHMFHSFTSLAIKFIPNLPYGNWILLWLVGQFVFVVFDYALSMLIDFYYTHFSKL